MLLPQETHAIEYLASPGARGFEPTLEIGIFLLELLNSLGIQLGAPGGRVERLHTRLRMKRALPEGRELIPQMSHELVQLVKRFDVRSFAV